MSGGKQGRKLGEEKPSGSSLRPISKARVADNAPRSAKSLEEGEMQVMLLMY